MWLMFYSHAVVKSLYILLQEMINECTGQGVYVYMLGLLLQGVLKR